MRVCWPVGHLSRLALAVGDVRDRSKSFICLLVYLFISLFVVLY